mmetsp:Transcript_38199/g.65515  ORF Transcript_38199/g.65515 Transcript_38199/m.65515 type:complete len:621 (-) Transcript_38199:29-1891(-)
MQRFISRQPLGSFCRLIQRRSLVSSSSLIFNNNLSTFNQTNYKSFTTNLVPTINTQRSYATPKKRKGAGTNKVILTLSEINKILPAGQRTIFKDINLSFFHGSKIGILGINGSGKTSLLRIIAGEDDEYEGEVQFAPNIRVGYLSQEPELDEDLTVYENILEGIDDKLDILDDHDELAVISKTRKLTNQEQADLDRLAKQIQTMGIRHLKGKVKRAMEALRCPPPNADVTKLSGGEKRRVALCKTLIAAPDFLILDEPTNHLDTDSVQWLEQYLAQFPGTVLAVTHDRYFLDNVAGWILEIDRGQTIPFQGNYTEWLSEKAKRLEMEASKDAAFSKALKKELQWINQPAKARQAKNKARVKRYEEMLEKNKTEKYKPGNIVIPPGPRLGGVVLSVENLSKNFGNRTLFKDVSFVIAPGSIVGIVGPNGSGKTTLFRIITGEIPPDNGEVTFGSTAKLGYITQTRDTLAENATVYEEISEGHPAIPFGDTTLDSRTYVASFAFSGKDQSKEVGLLSGGERNRVHLAKMLKHAPNVLLLDEPTNDLDLEVLRKLEDAIENFAGVAVIVSHDRWFLDRLCTHIIAIEPNESVYYHQGNYSEYLDNRQQRLGEEKKKHFTKLGV